MSTLAIPVQGTGYLHEAEQVMQSVSRTFAVAARLLPAAVRDDVVLLYLVLRTLDDLVDEGDDRAPAAVEALESWITSDLVESREAAILDDLCRRHPLPRASLAAFAQGMRDDLAGPDIVTEDDLDVYCSRVAGAVGEMMAAILGVRDDRAWRAACALGCAMQRTNILRDVDEDMGNGRVYLARDTLDRFGITDLASQDRTALYRDQIARADALFDEGLAGVPMLLNGDRAIAAAAVMYREILREIERGGYGAGRDRAVVSGRRKAWLMGVALMRPAHWS